MNSSTSGDADISRREAAMGIIDVDGILGTVDAAYQESMDAAGDAFKAAIVGKYWEHPGETVRSTGERVGSPRNIVDKGDLVRSQTQTAIGAGETEFEWEAEHAAPNYFGRRLADGRVIPPKRWAENAIRGDFSAPAHYQRQNALLDLPADFARRLRTKLGSE